MPDVSLRPVTTGDAEAIRAIYSPIVETTHLSFELEVPSPEEIARRIAEHADQLPWLVAVEDDRLVGYAYATPHASREAYRWAVDTSIYLDPVARGRGVGTVLYQDLLTRLRMLGYVSAFAGVALPNPASVALHQRVGFVATGSFPVAGFKLGRWIDVSLWRCGLAEPDEDPTPPLPWTSERSGAPPIAPPGATFLVGEQWGPWDGALAVTALWGRQLRVLTFSWRRAQVRSDATAITDQGRLRTPVQGPDGNLYLTTDVGGGGGSILRVVPS